MTHKFCATIGKTKLVRVRELVLVAFSGSPNSSALLHLIQEVGVCDLQVLCHCRQDQVSES